MQVARSARLPLTLVMFELSEVGMTIASTSVHSASLLWYISRCMERFRVVLTVLFDGIVAHGWAGGGLEIGHASPLFMGANWCISQFIAFQSARSAVRSVQVGLPGLKCA
jgi:hypothetical protein